IANESRNWWEADERPEPRSLGLLPSGSDPVGEWLVHRQPPASYIGPIAPESKLRRVNLCIPVSHQSWPGYVPAIPLRDALCHPKRGHRDKPGDDTVAEYHGLLALVAPPTARKGHGSCRRLAADACSADKRRQLPMADPGAAPARS